MRGEVFFDGLGGTDIPRSKTHLNIQKDINYCWIIQKRWVAYEIPQVPSVKRITGLILTKWFSYIEFV